MNKHSVVLPSKSIVKEQSKSLGHDYGGRPSYLLRFLGIVCEKIRLISEFW